MTTFISKLLNKLTLKQPPLSVMMIGLDDSGKTSIVNTLITHSPNLNASSIPTVIDRAPDDGTNTKKISLSDRDQSLSSSTLSSFSIGESKNFDPSVKPTIGYNYEQIKYRGHPINILDFSGQSKYRSLWQEFLNCVDGIVFVIDSSDLIRMVVVQDELETVLSHPFFATLKPNVPPKLASSTSENDNTLSNQIISQQFAQKQVVIEQGKLHLSPLSDWPTQRGASSNGRGGKLRAKIPILFMANKADLDTSIDHRAVAEVLKLDQVPGERHPWHVQATSVRTIDGIIEGFDWLIKEILEGH